METAPPPPVTTRGRRVRRRPVVPRAEGSATVFTVLRRMRAPLITLIVIFFVSVLGLSKKEAERSLKR